VWTLVASIISYQASIAGIKDTIAVLVKNDFDIRRHVLMWDLTEREQFRDGLEEVLAHCSHSRTTVSNWTSTKGIQINKSAVFKKGSIIMGPTYETCTCSEAQTHFFTFFSPANIVVLLWISCILKSKSNLFPYVIWRPLVLCIIAVRDNLSLWHVLGVKITENCCLRIYNVMKNKTLLKSKYIFAFFSFLE